MLLRINLDSLYYLIGTRQLHDMLARLIASVIFSITNSYKITSLTAGDHKCIEQCYANSQKKGLCYPLVQELCIILPR